mgnify:CR=1
MDDRKSPELVPVEHLSLDDLLCNLLTSDYRGRDYKKDCLLQILLISHEMKPRCPIARALRKIFKAPTQRFMLTWNKIVYYRP